MKSKLIGICTLIISTILQAQIPPSVDPSQVVTGITA
jgi:hypothetical protein